MIALRLAKEGYWGGDPERVLNGRVDLVLEAAEYEVFINKYIEAGAGS
jgi:hypothetical protein